MKTIALQILLILVTTAVAEARNFDYAVYVHQIDGQPKVDISSSLPETDKRHLSIAEAIAFLKAAPHGRGPNGIGILVDFGCDGSEILSVVLKSSDMSLKYFEDFAAGGIRERLLAAQAAAKKPSP